MINWVIGLCVRNKFLVFTIVGVACVLGGWTMMDLPVDAMPDLSETQVSFFRAGTEVPMSWKTRSPIPSFPP
jgi:Cu/Ag efflux pump CusA